MTVEMNEMCWSIIHSTLDYRIKKIEESIDSIADVELREMMKRENELGRMLIKCRTILEGEIISLIRLLVNSSERPVYCFEVIELLNICHG